MLMLIEPFNAAHAYMEVCIPIHWRNALHPNLSVARIASFFVVCIAHALSFVRSRRAQNNGYCQPFLNVVTLIVDAKAVDVK